MARASPSLRRVAAVFGLDMPLHLNTIILVASSRRRGGARSGRGSTGLPVRCAAYSAIWSKPKPNCSLISYALPSSVIGRSVTENNSFQLGLFGRKQKICQQFIRNETLASISGEKVNTNPLLVGAAAEAFLKLGAKRVVVGEGPGHQRDTYLVLAESGLEAHVGAGGTEAFTAR
jgi:hypothetical protein